MPAEARALIENPASEPVFSAVSVWEVAIKNGLGRADFNVDPRLLLHGLRENSYRELSVTAEHAAAVDPLPPIHTDPFDRLPVAQARIEGLTLLTADESVGRYPGPIRLVARQPQAAAPAPPDQKK